MHVIYFHISSYAKVCDNLVDLGNLQLIPIPNTGLSLEFTSHHKKNGWQSSLHIFPYHRRVLVITVLYSLANRAIFPE